MGPPQVPHNWSISGPEDEATASGPSGPRRTSHLGSSTHMRIFGRILAVLGILALFGLITGAAYTAGLAASGTAVQPMAYGLGFGFFGFGLFHFFGFILFFFLPVSYT